MNILIVNTAFENANYIVVKNEQIFGCEADSNSKHSETSLVNIDKMLTQSGLALEDLDVIAVNIGPGSFTGIRIGVAVVKGFASAFPQIKLIGFDSFSPLAYAHPDKKLVCIKASKDDYYVAQNTSGISTNPSTAPNQDIENNDDAYIFCGKYQTIELVKYVKNAINQKSFNDINSINPLYVKLSQAEKEFLKKENK